MGFEAQLLADLRDHLQITWEDATTNRTLEQSIANAKTYFNELCAKEFTYEEVSIERELLLERCRYAWNNALDEFETNYAKNLQRLIMKIALEQYSAGV